MQTVDRHGGGSHFVRPDRVYRTGVLTSSMGFDPGSDVQSVAASFTQYPADLGLGGLRGPSNVFQRIGNWFRAKKAQKQMNDAVMADIAHGTMQSAAYAAVGQAVAPVQVSKETMVAFLQAGNVPDNFARSQASTSWRRFSNPWWNG